MLARLSLFFLAVYAVASVIALGWSGWRVTQGQISALTAAILWGVVLVLTLNRLPQPLLPGLQARERIFRVVALAAFAAGLLSTDRGPLLWWCLSGLGALLLLMRWRWRH